MTIKINNDRIRIRPSAIDSFYDCSYKWAKTFLEGVYSTPNSRAAIGTAIHAGVEKSWQELIASGKQATIQQHNKTMMRDAAIESFQEETKDGVSFGMDETASTCEKEVLNGLDAWIEDISPFLPVPSAVETFVKIDIDNPFVTELGGTIDYIGGGVIDDIKTSKRKISEGAYDTQQGIYKYLAEANGHTVKFNRLQNVVLTKNPTGQILTIEPNVTKAKGLVNSMLDTLTIAAADIIPIDVLFRGNPNSNFCSSRFCANYDACPYVNGDVKPAVVPKEIKL